MSLILEQYNQFLKAFEAANFPAMNSDEAVVESIRRNQSSSLMNDFFKVMERTNLSQLASTDDLSIYSSSQSVDHFDIFLKLFEAVQEVTVHSTSTSSFESKSKRLNSKESFVSKNSFAELSSQQSNDEDSYWGHFHGFVEVLEDVIIA
jgi:hypothetical protein